MNRDIWWCIFSLGHPNIPPLVVVRGSQGLEAMEAKGIPLQDAAINDIQYISERYSSAVLDSELQDGNSAEATCSETRPSESRVAHDTTNFAKQISTGWSRYGERFTDGDGKC